MRPVPVLLAIALSAPGAVLAAGADGLSVPAGTGFWSRVQGRVALGTGAPQLPGALPDASANRLAGLSVIGDYYFSLPASGGFRASGGVVLGQGLLWGGSARLGDPTARLSIDRSRTGTPDGSEAATVPYLGIGYSGLSHTGRFGFSADLGLQGLSGGQRVQLGRAPGSGTNLDDALRELRLTPTLQLAVSYAF